MGIPIDIEKIRIRLEVELAEAQETVTRIRQELEHVNAVEVLAKTTSVHQSEMELSDPNLGFSGLGPRDAVVRLLSESPNKRWSMGEVRDALMGKNLRTSAKSPSQFYNILQATLHRLAKQKKAVQIETQDGRRFTAPPKTVTSQGWLQPYGSETPG